MLAEKLLALDPEQQNMLGFAKAEQLYYLALLHGKNSGYITRAVKNGGAYEQWHYRYKHFPPSVGKENVFLSMNTFTRPCRKIEYLDTLNAIFVDIDFYTIPNCTLKKVLTLYETLIMQGLLPRATAIVSSGRGMYLEWKIESVGTVQVGQWQEIEHYFAFLFNAVGADLQATDVSRVLRLPGTVYTKGEIRSTVDLLDFRPSLVYALESLAQYVSVIPEIEIEASPTKPTKERKKRKPSRIAKLFNIYNLNYTRIKDLIQLCEIRNWDMSHHRELTLFLYRYWSVCFYRDAELAIEKTLELNAQFILPLSESEATNATKSAEKAFEKWDSEEIVAYYGVERRKGYNYSNRRLIELLAITAEEQKLMKTIVGTAEKYRRSNKKRSQARRNKAGLTAREQAKQDRIDVITVMLKQGENQSGIARKLSITRQAVSKIVKNL